MQLSLGLRAIICQKLVARKSGGRLAALEILLNSPRIKKLILEGDTTKIPAAIQASRTEGMQTFNQALATAYFQKQITLEMALSRSSNTDELTEMINRGASLLGRAQPAAMAKGAAPGKR